MALRDGEASFELAYEITPLGFHGAHERSEIFAVRSPQGRRGLILFCLRMRPLRWASYEPTNVGTVSLFAAPGTGKPLSGLHMPSGTARPHTGQRMTPFRWAPQEPKKVVTVSHFAAPRERDDSFGIRSPHGRRCLILIRGDRYSAGPPKRPRKWRQCRCSQAPGAARSHSDPRRTSRRWATQKPTKVAAVSHFAAPRDVEVSF